MKKRILLIFIAMITASLSGDVKRDTERDVRGNKTVNNFSRYSSVELSLKKSLFEPGEDVTVNFIIRNSGFDTIRIYPAGDPLLTYQFFLTDKQGRKIQGVNGSVEQRATEVGQRTVNQWGDRVKEVILHPGESFEKQMFLNDYYELEPGQEYRLSGYYYPDFRDKFFVRSKNIALIRIAEDKEQRYLSYLPEEAHTESELKLTPEETIYLFLSAELKRNPINYIKFLDLRKYITSYDKFASRFARSSEREKIKLLKDFELYLRKMPEDRLRYFKILKKEFDYFVGGEIKDTGRTYINVRAERESKGFKVLYNYRYTLERNRNKPGFWKIVAVNASVLR